MMSELMTTNNFKHQEYEEGQLPDDGHHSVALSTQKVAGQQSILPSKQELSSDEIIFETIPHKDYDGSKRKERRIMKPDSKQRTHKDKDRERDRNQRKDKYKPTSDSKNYHNKDPNAQKRPSEHHHTPPNSHMQSSFHLPPSHSHLGPSHLGPSHVPPAQLHPTAFLHPQASQAWGIPPYYQHPMVPPSGYFMHPGYSPFMMGHPPSVYSPVPNYPLHDYPMGDYTKMDPHQTSITDRGKDNLPKPSGSKSNRQIVITTVVSQISKTINQLPQVEAKILLEILKDCLQFLKWSTKCPNPKSEFEKSHHGAIKSAYEQALMRLEKLIEGVEKYEGPRPQGGIKDKIQHLLHKLQIEGLYSKLRERKVGKKVQEEKNKSEIQRMLDILVRDPRKLIK